METKETKVLTSDEKRQMFKVTRRYMSLSFTEHFFPTLKEAQNWIDETLRDAERLYKVLTYADYGLEVMNVTRLGGKRVTEVYAPVVLTRSRKKAMILFFTIDEPGREIA